MNHFEEWKGKLTLTEFVEGILMCMPCNKCPARRTCRFDADGCEEHFRRWAEKEVAK